MDVADPLATGNAQCNSVRRGTISLVTSRPAAAHRARHGAAASWRPQRDRGLLRRRLLVAGHLQQSLQRADRDAAQHLAASRSAGDGGDPVVRGETGDQTGQESRSAGRRAAPGVTAMDITVHHAFLPHGDPEAALAFYRDTLGFEVRNDVGQGTMRWITVAPGLHPPAVDPGITDDERRTIAEMMAKGPYATIVLRHHRPGHQGPRRHLRAV